MSESFVIDNSVVMTWCFKDETNHYADAVLDSLEMFTAVVPSIWLLEVGNVLLTAERKKRLSQADSTRFISLLNELPIIIEPEPQDRVLKDILALAREHQLSSYDASYLDLAMRKGLPIATLDNGLIKAAGSCQVSIVNE